MTIDQIQCVSNSCVFVAIRFVLYPLVIYSIASLLFSGVKKWRNVRTFAMHFTVLVFFVALWGLLIYETITGDYVLAAKLRDVIITPILVIMVFFIWRAVIREDRERIIQIQQQIIKGEQNNVI